METQIQFFTEEPLVFRLNNAEIYKKWLNQIVQKHKFEIEQLNYIFCTDEYLHKINVEYLNHDTLTDIITFDNSDTENVLESDIFISIERVEENAKERNLSFELELKRVLAHGVLHLLGFKDKTKEEAEKMRAKEDWAIEIFE